MMNHGSNTTAQWRPSTQAASSDEHSQADVCFLLVEDNDDHALLVERTLCRSSHEAKITRVSDGEEALQYLRGEGAYADRSLPDVVLMDLNLPKYSGHEVLAAIRDDPTLACLPVVVLSSSNAVVDRNNAYRGHANSYLVKPSDFQRFRSMINQVATYWGSWNEPPACFD